MSQYYMNRNRQESDHNEHEVHQQNCSHGAHPANQLNLGWFNNGVEAAASAKRTYPQVASVINGCMYCNPEADFRTH